MLYGWNLDYYLTTVYQFHMLRYSIVLCRFISFLSYFAAQSSAWLRVFVCLDRYLSLSRIHKTWFGHSKNVLIIIACIMGAVLLTAWVHHGSKVTKILCNFDLHSV